MGSIVGIVVELAVIVLLGFTVTYCIILDRRLQRLRADETSIRQTVIDLGMATDRAERAIDGLRQTIVESETSLGERLKAAEAISADLDSCIRSGDQVLSRISGIVGSAREAIADAETRMHPVTQREVPPAPEPVPQPMRTSVINTAAAAEAFAERARRRMQGIAA
jgi:Domain of unknown function (DUF6468)